MTGKLFLRFARASLRNTNIDEVTLADMETVIVLPHLMRNYDFIQKLFFNSNSFIDII